MMQADQIIVVYYSNTMNMTGPVKLPATLSLYFVYRIHPQGAQFSIYLLFTVYCTLYIITLFLIVMFFFLLANFLQIVMRKYSGYEYIAFGYLRFSDCKTFCTI